MTTVVDASVVVAALVEPAAAGRWAGEIPGRRDLAAPHLLPAEVANVLRRLVARGRIVPDVAWQAQVDLAALPIAYYPFEPFAPRVWALRDNLRSYDAWYVAIAEDLDAPLATLDDRMVRSPGPRCTFLTPDAA